MYYAQYCESLLFILPALNITFIAKPGRTEPLNDDSAARCLTEACIWKCQGNLLICSDENVFAKCILYAFQKPCF